MAPRRITSTDVHLHWTFKARTAQLRLARVTLEPLIWNGVCRLSRDVCYVRFYPGGRVGYSFVDYAKIEPDPHLLWLPSFKVEMLAELERRFQAHLAVRALTGTTFRSPRTSPAWSNAPAEWVRDGTPCERCPPCVAERIELNKPKERHAVQIG